MADPKRKSPEGNNVLLTGAEMLVLQQNVKQYLAIRKTRPWTDHEKGEFLKLRERLVPCLIQYQEVVRSSSEADLVLSARPANSQPSSRKASATMQNTSVRPPALTEALGNQKARPSPARPKKSLPLKPLQLQQPRMQQQTSITPHITRSGSPANHKGAKAAAQTGSGDRLGKRSKMEIFQDNKAGSKTAKRPRVAYSEDVTDVDDVENKENMDPEQEAIHRAFNESKPLQDKTNQMWSKGQTPLSPTSKMVEKISTLTRKSSSTTKTVNDENTVNTTTATVKTVTTPSRKKASTLSVTPARAKNLVRPSPVNPKDVLPPRQRAHTVGAVTTLSAPINPIAPPKATDIAQRRKSLVQTDQGPVSKQALETKAFVDNELHGTSCAGLTPGSGLISKFVTSADDDFSKARDELYRPQSSITGLEQGHTQSYQEIQASQESDGYPSSQEETFPMPNFLLHDLPEDQEFFVGGSDDDGQVGNLEDGTVDYEFVPSSTEVTTDFLPKLKIDPSNSTMKSTSFVDGVWCMDDFRGGVSSIVCAHSDRWLAIETPSQVQFWHLENRSTLPQVDSRWYRRLCLSKSYLCPMKTIFAYDDSFALAVNVADQCYTKVLLDVTGSFDPVSACFTARWTDMKAVDIDQAFIVETMDQGRMLILGSDKPGTLTLIPVLECADNNVVPASVKARALSCSNSSGAVSSVTNVRNAPFLILATMGDSMVLWDMQAGDSPISVNNLPLPQSKAVSATIPRQFFKQYESVLDSDPTALPVFEWPLLVTLKTNDPTSLKNDSDDQCLLYVVKGSAIRLVHGYNGSRYSDFMRASSRFLVCQSTHSGAEKLRLWDVLKPEAVLEISLNLSHTNPTKHSANLPRTRPPPPPSSQDSNLRRHSSLPLELDVFSDASTLSPPPDVLSSSQSSLTNEEGESTVLNVSAELLNLPAMPLAHNSETKKDWIELESVAISEQRGVVRFSIHDEQPWVVVTQQQRRLLHQDVLLSHHAYSWADSSCAVHIMDLRTVLAAH